MREGEGGTQGESQCQPSAPGCTEEVGSRRWSLGMGGVGQNEHSMGRCIYGHPEEMFSRRCPHRLETQERSLK